MMGFLKLIWRENQSDTETDESRKTQEFYPHFIHETW